MRPYFLWVVAGCCQNGVCCHTNYWKNHEKNIQKKNYFRPTDPNFFTIWNRNHKYFFYALQHERRITVLRNFNTDSHFVLKFSSLNICWNLESILTFFFLFGIFYKLKQIRKSKYYNDEIKRFTYVTSWSSPWKTQVGIRQCQPNCRPAKRQLYI